MAIDVVLAGLMLICLDGQPNCPVGEHGNTAWVLKASDTIKPCGWDARINTALELHFSRDHFEVADHDEQLVECKEDWFCIIKDDCASGRCKARDICINSDQNGKQRLEESLQWLPLLDKLDRRFKAISLSRLNDPNYVPIRLHFRGGVIGAGPKWFSWAPAPTRWFRSNGEADESLPSELSDHVKVTYAGAKTLAFTLCDGKPLIKLTLKQGINTSQVLLQNSADSRPRADEVGGFDDLAYLLWYYRLGEWDTADGLCPNYTPEKRDAILLRCLQEHKNLRCSVGAGQSATIYWPTVLKSGF